MRPSRRPGSFGVARHRALRTLENTVVALLCAVATSCGDPTGPSAASIAANSSIALSGTPGGLVATKPSVIVKDANGAPVEGVTVDFAVTSGGGSATGTSATTAASGIATVGSWTLGPVAGTNVMTATVAGLAPVTFTATALTPASSIVVSAGSTTAQNRVALAVQPVIQLRDASGAALQQAGATVTVAITSGGGTLGGSTTATTTSAGAATFSGLSISGTIGSRTLTFSVSGSTATTTLTVNVTAGTASTIAINAGNSQTAVPGAAVAVAPSVIVKDQDGNVVTGTAVTFAVASGGGSVTGASQTTNASGIATVGSWTLGSAVGANSLTATSTGLTGSPVTFTASAVAPATKLGVTTAPTGSVANRATFPAQPVVQLQDASGNAVALAGTVITVAITAGGGTLNGPLTATTSATGAATFTGLSISGTVGARTLTFTATGLTAATATVTTTAGPATTMAINAGNGQSAVGGTAVAVAPSVIITDADANPVSGTAVTFAVATGGGSITGAAATSNTSGIAAVGSWTLGATPATNTLTATSTGLTGSPITFTATGVGSGAVLTYGASSERIALLDPAATLTPTIGIFNGGSSQPATAATYVSRATSVATVNTSGKITAVAAGQAWIVANYQTVFDSIFVIVTKSASSPVLRADITDHGVLRTTPLTINVTLDPRTTTTLGSAVVTIGFETQNNMFSSTSMTVPTQTVQPIAANVGTGVYRSTVAAANGLTGPVVMGQLKLTASGAVGLVGYLTFTFTSVASTSGGDILSTTTSTRYPIIIK